jgi:polar amino acid transport system substrate-binding protein
MSYLDHGKAVGMNVEMTELFGQYLGMKVELVDYDYPAVITSIAAGKVDMSGCNFAVTPDRLDSNDVYFANPFYATYAAIAYNSDKVTTPTPVENVYGTLQVDGSFKVHGDTNSNVAPMSQTTKSYADYYGAKFGFNTGFVYKVFIDEFTPSETLYYTDVSALMEAVKKGKVDLGICDSSSVMSYTAENPELMGLEIPAEIFESDMGFGCNDVELREKFNEFLKSITDDGTLAELREKWFSALPSNEMEMPEIENPSAGRTIRATVTGNTVPFCYVGKDGKLMGYDSELLIRFSNYAGMNITLQTADFNALIPELMSGKSDIVTAGMSITAERQKQFNFTDPTYTDTASMLVLNPNYKGTESKSTGFFAKFKDSIKRNLIDDNRYKLILDGLKVTIEIALWSMLFGTVLGAIMAYILTRKNKFAKLLGKFIAGIINGLPTVTLLMVAYYVIFGSSTVNPVIIAIATFSVIMGIRIGEILQSAIDTVDKTEIEAARATGFSAVGAFGNVTLPQTVKRALAPYMTSFVMLVKETAIVGYVAIQDLMRASDIIRSRTYDAYFPLIFVAVIYLVVTTICIMLFKFIIKKINKSVGEGN